MQKKNELTKDQMAEYATWFFNKNFKTLTEAARYYETDNSVITYVKQGVRAPTESMLLSFGYTKAKVYKRVK